jgi:hypothetical protein
MSNLSSITLEDLAAQQESAAMKLAKSGGKDQEERTGEGFVDPFTIGVPFPVEFTSQTTKPGYTVGTLQAEIGLSIITDGAKRKAGKFWMDLPLIGADYAGTADNEVVFLEKAGAKFLKFLRALDPVKFSVFASMDKSNPKKWVYLDHDGNPMSAKVREARAANIDKAVVTVAEGVASGNISFVGEQAVLTKATNPNNAKRPYLNWSSIKA